MAAVYLDSQLGFQAERGWEKGSQGQVLFVKLSHLDSGRIILPRTSPFLLLSGLWSLGNQVFHLTQCFSEEKKYQKNQPWDSLGRKKKRESGYWSEVAVLATVCLWIYRGKSGKTESRGAECWQCQLGVLIRSGENNFRVQFQFWVCLMKNISDCGLGQWGFHVVSSLDVLCGGNHVSTSVFLSVKLGTSKLGSHNL